jgi:hypothetical protein
VSTRFLCFLLARVPLTAAARDNGAWPRLPKAGALSRVRRFERMPGRLDLVGERPAAAGADEVRAGFVVVLIDGVSGFGVKTEELDRRVLGLAKGFKMKVEDLQKLSSESVRFRFDTKFLKASGSKFSSSDKSRVLWLRLREGAEEGTIAGTFR